MGLKRVLISVAPFIAIIALVGFNLLAENKLLKNKILKTSIKAVLIIGVLFLPFSGNKAAINWKNDFSLSASQNLANECVPYINTIKSTHSTFIFSAPYLSELLDINYFDKTLRKPMSFDILEQLQSSDIIIWDSWFSYVENGISKEKILVNKNLTLLKTFTIDNDREITYLVFKKK
jgi:hypothetical protein